MTSIAIVGAAGACGRQLAIELLGGDVGLPVGRLQLVAHQGGVSEHEIHGLCADLRDAFCDHHASVEAVIDPGDVDAEFVVMLAGRTIPTDPRANVDRSLLARSNFEMFTSYAETLARKPGRPPFVIVQSNPVEAGVAAFAAALGPDRVVGAGAHSDTQRFRRELATTFGVRRPDVTALMLGQHGDYLVPAWSQVRVAGLDRSGLVDRLQALRARRALRDLPSEIAEVRGRLLGLIADGDADAAFVEIAAQPPDVRAAVKPFLIHFSSGHTTEVMTAHAVRDLVDALVSDRPVETALQVSLGGEFLGLAGVGAIPVVLAADGWRPRHDVVLAEDERRALADAFAAIERAAAVLDGADR